MSDRIHQILSALLLREVADPRLRGVTVTEVELDPELVVAKIYVSALGDESREQDVMRGLQRAKGFLRRQLAKRIRLRTTPELFFFWDYTLDQAERINQIISKLEIPVEAEDDARRDS